MFSQQSTIFPKQIKLDDYEPYQNNHLIILQSSNLLLGTGSRTSTAAIVLVKCLHNLIQEGQIQIKNKKILELGSGIGLVGIYLAALGANVTMTDMGALRDVIQKNININKKMIKGSIQFQIASWKKTNCIQASNCKDKMIQQKQTISTSSSEKHKQVCLQHLTKSQQFNITLVCECGGLIDLQNQLKFISKDGMILAFMKRQNWDDGLNQRQVQEYLVQNLFQYQKIKNYHPDYIDNRIVIMKIFNNKNYKQQLQKQNKNKNEQINQKISKIKLKQEQEQEIQQ